ncbi:Os01g0622500 [Oryza sativa Japonica Group]|uniref:Os01g0622500 protein n=1 Tax=Oryza sativa subsp. japonica TaxID=39947 RepID=A0A0P0V5E5_ORYSJ|nr:hypothetical protein EE612_004146 [Oryza sativa]BAS73223.1 Os01g0622500 [Oryza sativa Japonica Group]
MVRGRLRPSATSQSIWLSIGLGLRPLHHLVVDLPVSTIQAHSAFRSGDGCLAVAGFGELGGRGRSPRRWWS